MPRKSTSTPDDAAVARRAYELYQERGGHHGRHEDDWYRAEAELRAPATDGRKRATKPAARASTPKAPRKKTATATRKTAARPPRSPGA